MSTSSSWGAKVMTAERHSASRAGGASSLPRWLVATLVGASAAVVLPHCAPTKPPRNVPSRLAVEPGPPPAFAYAMVDGRGVLREVALRGRPAVLIFVTTYDLASQAQARYLSTFFRRSRPNVRAAAIMLESDGNRPLMVMFRDTLGLEYPVAVGDAEAVAGKGPFGDVSVPTTLVLDGAGRIVARRQGLVTDTELDEIVGELRKGD